VEPVAIAYATDDAACPSRERFLETVLRYTSKWKAVESSSANRRFDVRLASQPPSFAGTLAITSSDGKTTTREIVGPDCDAVARALAVVMALALDPQAHITEPPREEAPRPKPVPPTPASPAPSPPPPAPGSSSGPTAREIASSARPSKTRPSWLAWAIEGRVEVTSAVTTGVLPVFGAALDLRTTLPATFPSWLAPSLAVGVRQSLPREVTVAGGASSFLWTAGTVRLCPVRFVTLSTRLDIAPCAEIDMGVLRASGRGLPHARSSASSWLDRGGSLRTTFRIGESWAVGASVLVTAPQSRHRFTLANGELISQAPSVGVTGGLLGELRL
jgi:hypothetical protein